MRFLGRAIALGAAVYLLVLVVMAPASVFEILLPDTIVLNNLSGSLWHGQAQSARVDEVTLGPITWDLNPGRLVSLTLAYRMSFLEPGLSGQGEIAFSPFSTQARGLTLLMDAALLNPYLDDFGRLQGRFDVRMERLKLSDGMPEWVQGVLEWKNANFRYSKRLRLGDVKAVLTEEDDVSVALLSNTGGDLKLTGRLSLTDDGEYHIRINSVPTPRTPKDVRNTLNLLGKPDPAGGVTVERTGKLDS